MAQPGPPGSGMHPGGMAPMPPMGYQNPMQQQQQQQQQQPRTEDKLITKCKELMGPLKEKWSLTLKEAALKINANGSADSKMPGEQQQGKFESHLEDFYATLDQIEVNLRSAIDCQSQISSSQRYMPIVPQPRLTVIDHAPKDFLTYPEYIATSKQQVAFANDMRQLLNRAARDVVEQNYAVPQQQQQPQPPPQAPPAPAPPPTSAQSGPTATN